MLETIRAELVQRLLTRMAKGRMPQIMGQTDGLGQILVEPQSTGNGAGDLRNLQRMGQPGPVQISFRREKHLRFLLEAAEGLAVQHPVSVSLEHRPDRVLFLLHHPPPALVAEGRPRCKGHTFDLFRALSYIHTGSPPFSAFPLSASAQPIPIAAPAAIVTHPVCRRGKYPVVSQNFARFFKSPLMDAVFIKRVRRKVPRHGPVLRPGSAPAAAPAAGLPCAPASASTESHDP